MSKFKRTSAKGVLFALAVWVTGLCMSAPAYSAVCFLPDNTGDCGNTSISIVTDEAQKGACDGKTSYTEEEYNKKFDDNCYTYTKGEKNGKTVYCDITKTESKGYVLDAQDHCCASGTAWDSKAEQCCAGGKCPVTCDSDLYVVKDDKCVCKNGSINGVCCPANTLLSNGVCCSEGTEGSNGICCPNGKEGKADGESLICCLPNQINKNGQCVDQIVEKTCSQIKSDYKASCAKGYQLTPAKDDKTGELVKDTKGTQCYTCEKILDGKNPLTVRLRLTCDGQTCPDDIYNGEYTFYYGNSDNKYLHSQPANRDSENEQDVISTISDWKTSDFLTQIEGYEDFYRINVHFRGILKPTNYHKKGDDSGEIVTSLDKTYSILEANSSEIDIEKNKSGAQEVIIPLNLTTKGDQPMPTYHIYAKVKCPGPYEEIKQCNALPEKWGYSDTDAVCPYRVTDLSTGYTTDYFSGSLYDNSYAKNAAGCADFRLLIDGKEAAKYWHHELYDQTVTSLDSQVEFGNTVVMAYFNGNAIKNVIDVSKLSDDEVLLHLSYQPTQSQFKKYNGTSFSLEVIPVNTNSEVAQPDKAGKSGFEYAFADNNGKMSVKKSQTISLPKITDKNTLYTYVGDIDTIHPVIRLQAVVDTITPKEMTTGSSTFTMPYAYKTYRKLDNPINGGVDLAGESYTHWVVQNGEVCTTNALNVYVTASRNVLSDIVTNLQDFGINADIVMKKGDIITYPDYGPWCMNLHPSYTYCYNYCQCDSKNDYNTGCASCVRNCEAGNLNSGVTSFLAKYAQTDGAGNYTTNKQRQISSGPTQSGYVYNDGAIYIIGSGFNISEDGTTDSKSESNYETCYKKTCEDFGLSSNLQAGMKCKNAASKCNLNCFKCAYEGCYSVEAECSTDIKDQYGSINNSNVFCTTPQSDTEGIHTTCERLAKNSYVQDSLEDTDSISDLSKFVEYFTNPDDSTSTDTRRCAVCIYTWD